MYVCVCSAAAMPAHFVCTVSATTFTDRHRGAPTVKTTKRSLANAASPLPPSEEAPSFTLNSIAVAQTVRWLVSQAERSSRLFVVEHNYADSLCTVKMVSQSDLEAAIRQKVDKVSALVVSDVSGGCGQAYDVIIVSEAFEGLNTLKRHRMINDLLKEQIAQLHAFSQKTYTPQQYEQLSGASAAAAASSSSNMNAGNGAQSAVTADTANAGASVGSSAATPGGNAASGATLGSAAARPSTLDTSVAQRGSKVHHRTSSSNVSVPELILTPDAADTKRSGGHNRQRSLTPNNLNDMVGGSSHGSPGGASGVSRLHYNQITSVEFWTELRDFLERRFMRDDSGSASPSPTPGRQRGEAEMVKVFEDFLQTQKIHMSGTCATGSSTAHLQQKAY